MAHPVDRVVLGRPVFATQACFSVWGLGGTAVRMRAAGSVLCYTDLVAHAGSVAAVGVATLRKSASLLLSLPGYLMPPTTYLLYILTVALVRAEVFLVSRKAIQYSKWAWAPGPYTGPSSGRTPCNIAQQSTRLLPFRAILLLELSSLLVQSCAG